MKLRLPVLTLLLLFSPYACANTSEPAMPKFTGNVCAIPMNTQKIMQKYTWKPGCPVPLNDLAEVKLSYWGFDHKAHQGILIVNKAVAGEVVSIFKVLYYQKFPIERIEPMDSFKGDDNAAMEVDNTSAFNCRAITGRPGVFSQHSYGSAIDINTFINPYVKGNEVLPRAAEKYTDRTQNHPGEITKNSLIYKEFIKRGWAWGGDWHDPKDYQHFEKKLGHENSEQKVLVARQ